MKKVFALTLALVCVLMPGLVGCSRDGGNSGGVETGNPEYAITMVSHFDPGLTDDTMPITRAKKAYEEKFNAKVEVLIYSSDVYKDKIISMISGKNSPELVQVSTLWMPTFAIQNILQPVDGLIDYASLPYQGLVETATWNGKHYVGNPNGVWGDLLWYNKTMFENNGVKTPLEYYHEGNWTWDTFLDCAKKLTGSNVWGFASPNTGIFVSTVSRNGLVTLNDQGTYEPAWNNERVRSAIQFTSDLVLKEKVWNPDLGYAKLNFKKGKVAMVPSPIGFIEDYCDGLTDEVDCVPMPVKEQGDEYITSGNGLFYGLGYNAENVDAAVEFLKILAQEEAIDLKNNVRTPLERQLTDAQLEMTRSVSENASMLTDANFTSWSAENMYMFWNAITIDAVPVATAIDQYEPLLVKAIQDVTG